jgi:hypothetical protein
MGILNRRTFLQLAGASCLASTTGILKAAVPSKSETSSHAPLLGTVAKVKAGSTAEETIKRVHDLGLPTWQIFF